MTSTAGASVSRRGAKLEPLLSDEELALGAVGVGASAAEALVLRSRTVLACAGGEVPLIIAFAPELRLSPDLLGKWRRRFLAERLDGLDNEPRPGRPPTINAPWRVDGWIGCTWGS